ncbi:hypothetical protein BC831DRAFT_550996 [Entophlyctis helioformis]|nr:hypothetical protein BC831DRAFT_550996 [Entophlyctis helioformis]
MQKPPSKRQQQSATADSAGLADHAPASPVRNAMTGISTAQGYKRSHLVSPPMPFGYSGVVPSHLEPILDRISQTSLLGMFEGEVVYCLKAFMSLSNTAKSASKAVSNAQMRLIRTQFRSCLEKFERHLTPEVYLKKCVETGEALLEIPGLHRIAEDECFAPALSGLTVQRPPTAGSSSSRATSAGTVRSETAAMATARPGVGILDKQNVPAAAANKYSPGGPRGINDGKRHAPVLVPAATSVSSGASSAPPSSLADTKHASSETSASSREQVFDEHLRYRALFGKLVCKYLAAMEIDPGLHGATAVSQVFDILDSFMDISKDAQKNDDFAWCVYIGTFHVMSICQELAKSGWTAKIMEYVTWTIETLEEYHPFCNAMHVPWRMECYSIYFKFCIELGHLTNAETMIERAWTKLEDIRANELSTTASAPNTKQASGNAKPKATDLPPRGNAPAAAAVTAAVEPVTERLCTLQAALHKINLFQFACEAKRLTLGRTPEQMILQKIALSGPLSPGAFPAAIIKPKVRSTTAPNPLAQASPVIARKDRPQPLAKGKAATMAPLPNSDESPTAAGAAGASLPASPVHPPVEAADAPSGMAASDPSPASLSSGFMFFPDAVAKGYVQVSTSKVALSSHHGVFPYSTFAYFGRGHSEQRAKQTVSCMRSLATVELSKTAHSSELRLSINSDWSNGLGLAQAPPQPQHVQDTGGVGDTPNGEDAMAKAVDNQHPQAPKPPKHQPQPMHPSQNRIQPRHHHHRQQPQQQPQPQPQQQSQQQPQQPQPQTQEATGEAADPKSKKLIPKKIRVAEETEDAKSKRLLMSDIQCLVQTLPEDRDRLSAIVFALRVVTCMENTLKITERTPDEPIMSDTVIARLVDTAFFIVTSAPNAISKDGAANQISDFKGGKKFRFPDLTQLAQDGRANDFFVDDLMLFNRFLFENRQWERLHCILQMAYPAIKNDSRIQNQYGLEIALRAAASRFLLTLHSDRRVLFEAKITGRATPSDLRLSRFELTDQVRLAVSDLFTTICDCIETTDFAAREPRLIYESAAILWYFAEPFVRELKSTKDAVFYAALGRQETLLSVLEFIHLLQSLYPHAEPATSAAISAKLALLLECIDSFADAARVLHVALESIETARIHLGEGSNVIMSTTVDPSFHPGLSRQVEVEESQSNPRGIAEDGKTIALRKQLSGIQIGLLSSLYRCRIKSAAQKEAQELRRREMEHLKLTQKRIYLNSAAKIPTEETLMENCGHDPVRRAFFMLTAASIADDQLSIEQKHRLLHEASSLLKAAQEREAQLLTFGDFDPTSAVSGDWSPVLVRRTPRSVTISPGRILHSKGRASQPKRWYQAFAAPAGEYLGKSNVDLLGTGDVVCQLPRKRVEITITHLLPCHAYDFTLVMHEKEPTGVSHGNPSRKIRIIPTLPMPLLLCWGFLSEVAHQVRCYDLADEAHLVLSTHFVCSRAPDHVLRRLATDDHTGIYHDPVYELFDDAIRQSSPGIIRAFVQSIFAAIDRSKADVHQGLSESVHGMGDMLSSQLCRLRACRDLLLAAELARQINDSPLLLLCALKAYQNLMPFILFDVPCAFVVHVLMLCHEIVLGNAAAFENDKNKGLRDFFVPITYHLVRRLIERDSFNIASQVSQESMQLINMSACTVEQRILNSASIEQSWLGYVFKPKRLRGNHTKSHYYAEFVFHAKVAVSNEPSKGVSQPRRPFDVLYEYLDVTMAQNSQLVAKLNTSRPDIHGSRTALTAPDPAPSKRPTVLHRKSLDMQTCLKDIYVLFATCGPEAIMQELIRFKKNPRYIEIVTRLVEWCLDRDLIEAALRVSTDIEDWVDKRTQTIVLIDQMADEGEAKRDVTIKRRKRHLFANDKRLLFENAKSTKPTAAALKQARQNQKQKLAREQEESRRKAKEAKDKETKEAREKEARERDAKEKEAKIQQAAAAAAASSKEDTNSSGASKASRSTPPTSAGHGSKETESTSPTSGASRPTSRPTSRSSRPTSSGDSTPKAQTRSSSRASSASPHGTSREEVAREDVEQASFLAMKRKRLQQRHAYFVGLSPAERERKDHAARVLDVQLSAMWHRRRYLRRLRTILDYEATWRSQLSYLHGKTLLLQLQKELTTAQPNLAEPNEFFDAEWFEYRRSGCLLLSSFAIFRSESVSIVADNDLAVGYNSVIADILQALVQSIVIATRAREWLKVIKSAKLLWDSLRFLFRHRKLSSELWRQNLWRGMHVAADSLMEALRAISIVRAEKDDAFRQLGFMSHLNTNRQPVRSAVLPFSTLTELQKGQFTGSWVDRFGESQSHIIDLPFFADFFLFTLETMQMSSKWHRIYEFGRRFQKLFHGVLDTVLVPLVDRAQLKVQGSLGAETGILRRPGHGARSMEMLLYARHLHSNYLFQKVRSVKMNANVSQEFVHASDAYEDAIALAHNEGDYDMFAVSAHEHGDMLFEHGNLAGACVFWSKCIDGLFRRDKALASWRSIVDLENTGRLESWGRPEANRLLMAVHGVYNSLLAGMAAAKIARFFYFNNHDKRSELVWLAAHLFIAPIMATIPHPVSYFEYAHYTPTSVFPFLNIFVDKFQCNPATMCDCLLFLATDLAAADMSLIVLPLASLMEHIACHVLKSFFHSARAVLLKAEALVHLGKISDGISKVAMLAKRTTLTPKRDEGGPENTFDDCAYPLQVPHGHALRQLVAIVFSDKAKALYPPHFMGEFELARSKMLLKIVEVAGLGMPFADGHRADILFDELDVGGPSGWLDGSASAHDPPSTDATNMYNNGTETKGNSNQPDSKQSNQRPGQRLEPDSLLSEMLDTIRISLFRIVQQKQFLIKNKLGSQNADADEGRTRRFYENENLISSMAALLSCFELIGITFFIQKRFKNAIKWFSSVRSFVVDLLAHGEPSKQKLGRMLASVVGSSFALRNRVLTIRALLADGFVRAAYDICIEGLEEASSCTSTFYSLKMTTHLLHACRRSAAHVSESQFAAHLKDASVLVKRASRIPICGLAVAQALEVIGDSHAAADARSLRSTSAGSLNKRARASSTNFSSEVPVIISGSRLSASVDKYSDSLVTFENLLRDSRVEPDKTLYDSISVQRLVAAFKLSSMRLRSGLHNSEADILGSVKAIMRVVFCRPLRVPIHVNAQLAFEAGSIFCHMRAKFPKSSAACRFLAFNAEKLLSYFLKEKCEAGGNGGYEHETIQSALLGLLALAIDNGGKRKKSARYLYDAARAFRMHHAIVNKAATGAKLSVEDYPAVILAELAAYKSAPTPDTVRELFEGHDLLYVEDSTVLDRNRITKLPILHQNDLLEYRAFLDGGIAAGRQDAAGCFIMDDREAALRQRVDRLHRMMCEKYTWYTDFCLTFAQDQSSGDLPVPDMTAALGWLSMPVSTQPPQDHADVIEFAQTVADLSPLVLEACGTAARTMVFYASLNTPARPESSRTSGSAGTNGPSTAATTEKRKAGSSADAGDGPGYSEPGPDRGVSTSAPSGAASQSKSAAEGDASDGDIPAPTESATNAAAETGSQRSLAINDTDPSGAAKSASGGPGTGSSGTIATQPPLGATVTSGSSSLATAAKQTRAPSGKKDDDNVRRKPESPLLEPVFRVTSVPLALIAAGEELTRLTLASLGQHELTGQASYKTEAETRWQALLSVLRVAVTSSTTSSESRAAAEQVDGSSMASSIPPLPPLTSRSVQLVGAMFDARQVHGCGLRGCPLIGTPPNPYLALFSDQAVGSGSGSAAGTAATPKKPQKASQQDDEEDRRVFAWIATHVQAMEDLP